MATNFAKLPELLKRTELGTLIDVTYISGHVQARFTAGRHFTLLEERRSVRFWRQTGSVLLVLSFTGFDPKRSLARQKSRTAASP